MTEALTDVLVSELVGESHTLRLMLNRLSVHDGGLELLNDGAVNSIALRNITISIVIIDLEVMCQVQVGLWTRVELTKSSIVHLVERSTTGAE